MLKVLVLRDVTLCSRVHSKRRDLSTAPHNATPRRPDSSVYQHHQRKLMFSIESRDVHIVWLPHRYVINPLNAELNPICHLLALLGGATIVVVSRLRVNYVIKIFLTYFITPSHCEWGKWFICCGCVAGTRQIGSIFLFYIFLTRNFNKNYKLKILPDKLQNRWPITTWNAHAIFKVLHNTKRKET